VKIEWGHPNGGDKMQGVWVKIGDFQPISRYISETVQDNGIGTIEG